MEAPFELWDAALLGTLRVRCGERSADHFQTRQTAMLFAYLVTYPRRHTREAMVDLLWPDADADSGRKRLSQAIWRIRQLLHGLCPDAGREVLTADRNTVGIDPAQISSDVARFRQDLKLAEKRDGEARAKLCERAVAEYGDSDGFLSGFYEDWVLAERQRLLTDYLAALTALSVHRERAGDWAQAVTWAERAVAADPLLEDSHRDLIRVLAASGQTASAQRQYDTLTRLLARELNSQPSAATRALMQQVQQDAENAPAPLAAAVSSHASPLQVTPLPVPLTTFYGRDAFSGEMLALVDTPAIRLITLLGTGGVGKTRLALELARTVAARSAEPSVAFVSLADITQPRLIAEAIAGALTAVREALPMLRIANALTTSPAAPPFLLILDNAEHLAEPIGAIATELLARIPCLTVFVTSQRSLGVSGEHEVMLPPLDLSPNGQEHAPSVHLFIDRAKSVRPGFPTDPASLEDVIQICRRLEGLPLAIELCAGWAQTLGTRQMLEMLARRFELLVSRRTDIPARHRTLRAAIEYSYIQLSEEMQELFVKLAVFRDGWTLAAAAEVCVGGSVPSALALLAQMREHSLIVAEETRSGDGMRYKMLESLRDFALEQRTMAQALEHDKAHADYFARFVQETVARMKGQEEVLWAARLDDEMENIRAALDYLASSHGTEQVWAVMAEVSRAWNVHGHAREARHWLERILVMDCPEQTLRARLLTAQAEALRRLSDFTEAAACAEEALTIWRELEDTRGMTECIALLGITAMLNNDFDRAQTLLTQALPLAQELNDTHIIAEVLNDLGRVAMALQDWQTASQRLTEGLELRRRLGDTRGICSSLNNLGLVQRYQGDYAAARTLLQAAASPQNQNQFVWYSVIDLNLASVERLEGNYAESLRLLIVATAITLAHGERRVLAWCVKEMGHLAVALKEYALGLRLLSCAESMRLSIGMSFKPLGPEDIERDRFVVTQSLGATETAASWAAGMEADPELLLSQAQISLTDCLNSESGQK